MQPSILVKQTEENKKQQDSDTQPEEFPIVSMAPGMKLENVIQQALFKKYPDWKNKNYNVSVTFEINKDNHAFGRFSYDGYNIVRDGKYHNAGEGIWFAAENNNSWTLTDVSYVGYNGTCQNFWKYNFPVDMIPDCWDNEKNIQIETKNPGKFYLNGMTEKDKKDIIKSFLVFIKDKPYAQYYALDNSYVLIINNSEKYLKGMILKEGMENHSVPNFYAVKIAGNWNVIFNGQDYPPCDIIEKYNFPASIVDECYDEANRTERTIL